MRLRLHVLGTPQLYLDDNPVATDRRKALALLTYLAVHDLWQGRQRYSREALSALLWPDYEQAKAFANLRRTIWDVHQSLGEIWLTANRETLQLNASADIDLDVARFQDLLSRGQKQTDARLRIALILDAVKLYRGHFLTGFNLKDAHPFNEWAFTESEDLRRKLSDSLMLLADGYCEIDEAAQAVPYARRLITLDPLNESWQRQLMRVYLRAGLPNSALKQYELCKKTLRIELGLDPQPETRALYEEIRRRESLAPQRAKQLGISALPLRGFSERETEMDEVPEVVDGGGSEFADREIRRQLWGRLKQPALVLALAMVGILMWRLTATAVPAAALRAAPQRDGMTLRYVPAGPFTMGDETAEPAVGDAQAHTVTLSAYWIDKTEVTNGMYAQCVMMRVCRPPGSDSSALHKHYYDDNHYADYPVVYASWNDANTYCKWAGRALPSEAQWEKAARGTDGRTYPWGNNAPNEELLNYNSSVGDTTKVGSYEKGQSPYGAYDMAGNVWEWVADWYSFGYYAGSPPANPVGPETGSLRVLRGGGWHINSCDVRSASRCNISPFVRYGDIGFRCALSSP